MSERAIRLRDAALAVLKKAGVASWQSAGETRLMVGEVGAFRIAYRTPFPKTPGPQPASSFQAVQAKRMLSYGLDVWAGVKVLNVEWDDCGTFTVISYKPGEWESP